MKEREEEEEKEKKERDELKEKVEEEKEEEENPFHGFVKIDCCHRDVCKPSDVKDLRYSLILRFIHSSLERFYERKKEKKDQV